MTKNRGFTLIEIMIVVVIIGILSAIAIPNFMKFRSRAWQAEAKANLAAVHNCQLIYFSDFDTFAGGEDAFDKIKFVPIAGRNRYTYILDQSILPGVIQIDNLPEGIPSTKEGFTCIAVSNIDQDPALDYWAINDDRDLRNEKVDAGGWKGNGSDLIH